MGRTIGRMLAIAIGLLLVGGCGGGDGSATAEPTATTAEIAHVPLAIDPPDQRPLRARRKGGRLIARAPLSGSAQPYSVLRISSECPQAGCTTGATADENGRWRSAVRVDATTGKPYARVSAQLSGESAVALVRLKAPGMKTPPKRKAKRQRGDRPAAIGGGEAGGGVTPPGSSAAEAELPAVPSTGGVSPSTAGGPGAIPAPSAATGTPTLHMIGDSLAEGTAPLLPAQLPGWSVTTDAETGRFLRVGMERWAATRSPTPPTVAAFSLFTNDSPSSVAAFEAAVRQTVEEPAGSACVVWATIARPPQGGTSYAAANTALERVAATYPTRLAVVPWARAVQANPDWLRSDRVHATPEGYAARARMYAEAARGCSGR